MPVNFFAGETRATVKTLMTALHAMLTGAGWTLEYADADAQIGGNAQSPGWDKSPAAQQSAGVVRYLMPGNGLAAWQIELAVTWLDNPEGYSLSVTSLRADGSNPGTPLVMTFNQSALGEWRLSAYEGGFVALLPGIDAAALLGVERKRSLSGAYTDDLVFYALTGGLYAFNAGGYSSDTYWSLALSRSPVAEGQPMPWLAVFEFDQWHRWPNATKSGERALPLGPWFYSGGVSGLPRLMLLAANGDTVNRQDTEVYIDGQTRLYYAIEYAYLLAGVRVLIAKE